LTTIYVAQQLHTHTHTFFLFAFVGFDKAHTNPLHTHPYIYHFKMKKKKKESNNYKTHMVGKWDLGHYSKELWPTERGFDSFYGLTCYGYTDYSLHTNKGGYYDLQDWNVLQGSFHPDKSDFNVYSTHLFGDRAVDIVNKHPKDESLFLYVPFNAVHNDLSVPENWESTPEYSVMFFNF
jgi:hypothetical protein